MSSLANDGRIKVFDVLLKRQEGFSFDFKWTSANSLFVSSIFKEATDFAVKNMFGQNLKKAELPKCTPYRLTCIIAV